MGTMTKALGAEIKTNKTKQSPAMHSMSYLNIAGGLASEMAGFLRAAEPRTSRPPFQLVIVGNSGDVVFECEVGADWKVQQWGLARKMRRSHFPATALLTDGAQVTRTFLIEREPDRTAFSGA